MLLMEAVKTQATSVTFLDLDVLSCLQNVLGVLWNHSSTAYRFVTDLVNLITVLKKLLPAWLNASTVPRMGHWRLTRRILLRVVYILKTL